ncbi:MAG TPA: response regulator [Candidatus Angelobacter sp.]
MQLNQASVMIVEDEPALCEIIGAWFARIAARVLTAGNGAEALKLLAGNHVDLIISDLRMPVMDGVTLLKRILISGPPSPSVIFISGFSDIDAREAYALGAEGFLQKPMDRQELLQAVKQSLLARNELWSNQMPETPSTVLDLSYPSLATALEQHKIAFGRGGFCIALPHQLPEGPIKIHVEFTQDKQILEGSGIVRWTSRAEQQSGIELLYLTPASRQWFSAWIGQISTPAFIPASSSSGSFLDARSA